MNDTLTKYELLTMLYSLQTLIKDGKSESALEVIEKVIKLAESTK